MTAGRLAELTGLTTGAITGVIDRLEKAGWSGASATTATGARCSSPSCRKMPPGSAGSTCRCSSRCRRSGAAIREEELRLLLRFANDGYKGVLEATEALKGLLDAPAEKAATKPRRTR